MPRSASETTLADAPQLHRMVVRVGAASAWLVAAVYLVASMVAGDPSLQLDAVGPIIAALLMSLQVALGREDAAIALFGSAAVIVVWHTLFGEGTTLVLASVGLVLIAALGMLFVPRHRVVAATLIALLLLGVPWLWAFPTKDRLLLGSVMVISYLFCHLVLSAVQRSLVALTVRYRMLFDGSPTAALEEDWSEAIAYVRSEYTGRPERIGQFLLAYPMVVEKAVSKARVLRVNEAALRLLEIDDPESLLGDRDPSVVTAENLEGWVDALVALYRREELWEAELPVRGRSGELRWLQARGVDTSSDRSGASIVVALADVTHIRARSEAMAQLVEAKDEFIATVSHELRTPLTAVLGLTAELAANRSLGEAERAELLEVVASQAEDMANIVEDLLVGAKAGMGTIVLEPKKVDLVDEVTVTLDGLGLEAQLPVDQPPPVLADPRRVRQILRNLLTNAQRYGGSRRRVEAGSDTTRAWIEIRDDGPGVPEEEAARIFHPYVTGMTRVPGSIGLGLAVSRRLAELMGGSLDYARAEGETVFRLELPLADVRDLASHTDRR